MKRYCLLTAVCLLMAFATSCYAAGQDPCQGVEMAWIQKHLKVDGAEIVSKKPESGLCTTIISINGQVVPLYVSKEFVIVGNMFKEQVAVTAPDVQKYRVQAQEQIDKVLKAKYKDLIGKLDTMVAFEYKPVKSPKQSNKTLYMFTDPLCPFCSSAGEAVKEMADNYGFGIKALLFNVHGQKGEQKSIEAVCKDFDLVQYLQPEWKKGQPPEKCDHGQKLYDQSMKFGKDIGIHSVPFFITGDGTIIRGADIKKIEEAVKS